MFRIGMVCAAVPALLRGASAEAGPPIPNDKKIIAFAPDLVGPTYLKEHIAELERIPIDGLIISVHPDGTMPDGWGTPDASLYLGRASGARGKRFIREDYRQGIANLKETKFNRFTDNFIDIPMSSGNAYDWFDQRWSMYAENAAVMAYVAKQGGLKGLEIDFEQYGGRNVPVPYPLSYHWRKDRSERTFDEVAAQVRKRGREMMEAIVAEYPDITVMILPSLGWDEGRDHPLLPAFADGLLEGMGPRTKLIDSMENSYPIMLHESFSQLRQTAEKKGVENSRVPRLYRERVEHGLGVYVDFDSGHTGTYDGWHTRPEEFEENYRSPKRLEHSLYNALTVSDKYVWLFVIHPQVWWQPHLLKPENVARQMKYSRGWRCRLCPHSQIPEEYIEAIRNCRKPHDLDWEPKRARSMEDRVLGKTEGAKPQEVAAKGPNILKNGGFEFWGGEKGNVPAPWEPDTKYVSREDVIVKEGSHSAKVSSKDPVEHIYITWHVPAAHYAGKTITFGVWTRSSFGYRGSLNLIDFVRTTGREDEGSGGNTRYDGEDGWWFITTTKTIRKNAYRVAFYLDSTLPPDGAIYFDGAIAVVEQSD